MTVTGNIQHAEVLLNKTRTTPFVESEARRDDLARWRCGSSRSRRRLGQGAGGDLFVVLHRERIQKTEFEKKSVTLDPALGGVQLTDKQENVELGKVVLPSNEPGVRLRQGGEGQVTRPRPRGGRRWRKSTVGDSSSTARPRPRASPASAGRRPWGPTGNSAPAGRRRGRTRRGRPRPRGCRRCRCRPRRCAAASRKAEPAPPLMIAKLEYGTTQDWNTDPGDVDNLMRHVRSGRRPVVRLEAHERRRAGRAAQGRQAVQDPGPVHQRPRGLRVHQGPAGRAACSTCWTAARCSATPAAAGRSSPTRSGPRSRPCSPTGPSTCCSSTTRSSGPSTSTRRSTSAPSRWAVEDRHRGAAGAARHEPRLPDGRDPVALGHELRLGRAHPRARLAAAARRRHPPGHQPRQLRRRAAAGGRDAGRDAAHQRQDGSSAAAIRAGPAAAPGRLGPRPQQHGAVAAPRGRRVDRWRWRSTSRASTRRRRRSRRSRSCT